MRRLAVGLMLAGLMVVPWFATVKPAGATVPGENGLLGRPVKPDPSTPSTQVIYDGHRARRIEGGLSPATPTRRFAASLEPAEAYFAAGP
jgi:hypothetical protein